MILSAQAYASKGIPKCNVNAAPCCGGGGGGGGGGGVLVVVVVMVMMAELRRCA